MERSRRNGDPLAIVIFDIDDFKSINDSYGHLAGDFVLQETCRICKLIIRPYDVFARFGGEEFIFCQVRMRSVLKPLQTGYGI